MNVYVAIGENIFKDSGKCINEKTLGVFKNQRAAEYFILDFHEKLCLNNKKKYRKSENTMINGGVCFSLSFETEHFQQSNLHYVFHYVYRKQNDNLYKNTFQIQMSLKFSHPL